MPKVAEIYINCPYCGDLLDCRQFAGHIQKKHPDKPQRFIVRQHPTEPVDTDNIKKVVG